MLRAEDVRVVAADVLKLRHVLEEVAHRISAEERQAKPRGDRVPQDFETNRRVGLTLPPQNVHHPAVGPQNRSGPSLQHLLDDAADVRVEEFRIGNTVDHEERQRLVGVKHQKVAALARQIDVNEPRVELSEHAVAVRRRRDDHGRFADDEPLGEERGGRREETLLGAVELDGVMLAICGPMRHWLKDSTRSYDSGMVAYARLLLVTAGALVALLASPAVMAEPAKVDGKWNVLLQLESITGHPVLTLKQDGEKLTGTYEGRYGPSALEGEIKESKIAFVVTFNAEGTRTTGVFQGTVDGATMGGSVEFEGAGSGTWSAVRAKAEPK